MFTAFAARFADPERDEKYASARMKLAHAAVLPGRVWNDTSVWITSTESRRTLSVNGFMDSVRYRLRSARQPVPLTQLADSRHVVNLTRLADNEYAWDTDVSYTIGAMTAADAGAFTAALFAAAEDRDEKELRQDVGAVIPRASRLLSELFRVDSVRTTTYADKSTLAIYALTMTPSGIEGRYPNYASYLRRYAEKARMHWTLTDHAGATFFDCAIMNGQLTLRVRTLDGAMMALSGPARPMPDSLTLNGDMTMKVRAFTVGFRKYHAEFTIVRTEHERAWSIVSRSEPEWVLPLISEHLLRTPLRRPFQGSGALFRIGVRDDSASGQSVLHRRLHLEVQESLILRFIGRLGSVAMSEFAGKVEKEENAWLYEIFGAFVADVRAM